MTCTAYLVCLVSTINGSRKTLLGRASASRGHKTKLEQSNFLRYLWNDPVEDSIEKVNKRKCSRHKYWHFKIFEVFKVS